MRYWTAAVFDTDRIGGATRAANQSVRGLLARLGIESGAVWLVLCAALVCLTVVAMRTAVGSPVWTLGLNALGTLPLAPVSWSHHWVWCVPVLLAAGVPAWRTRTAVTFAAGGLLLFLTTRPAAVLKGALRTLNVLNAPFMADGHRGEQEAAP